MRPPGVPESQGTYGLASLICGGAAIAFVFFNLVPFVGCIAGPLSVLGALGAVVLGVMAIIDGGKRGDAGERVRGFAGLALGLLPMCLLGLAVAFFSRSMFRDALGGGPPPTPVAVDAGRPTPAGE
jgi:hypothetical protein